MLNKITYTSMIKPGQHSILFYEDVKKGHAFRVDFIKEGLMKNENCVYVTVEDDEIFFEKSLSELGIDVLSKKNKQFHVFKIIDPFSTDSFQTSINQVWKKVTDTVKSPFRIACNIVGDISRLNENQVVELFNTEKCINEGFEKSKNLFLCTYYIGDINAESRKKVFSNALTSHHVAIFAPKGQTESLFYL